VLLQVVARFTVHNTVLGVRTAVAREAVVAEARELDVVRVLLVEHDFDVLVRVVARARLQRNAIRGEGRAFAVVHQTVAVKGELLAHGVVDAIPHNKLRTVTHVVVVLHTEALASLAFRAVQLELEVLRRVGRESSGRAVRRAVERRGRARGRVERRGSRLRSRRDGGRGQGAECERRGGGAADERLGVDLDVAAHERRLRFDVGGGDCVHRGVGGHCVICLRDESGERHAPVSAAALSTTARASPHW
jgi:hypothetical protein